MSPSIKHRNLLSVTPLQHPLTQCGPKTLHMFNISLPKSLTYLLLISYSLRILVKIKHVRYFNISTNIIFSGASIDVLTINDISGHSHKSARICILPTRKGHSHKSARLCIFNKERASTQVSQQEYAFFQQGKGHNYNLCLHNWESLATAITLLSIF